MGEMHSHYFINSEREKTDRESSNFSSNNKSLGAREKLIESRNMRKSNLASFSQVLCVKGICCGLEWIMWELAGSPCCISEVDFSQTQGYQNTLPADLRGSAGPQVFTRRLKKLMNVLIETNKPMQKKKKAKTKCMCCLTLDNFSHGFLCLSVSFAVHRDFRKLMSWASSPWDAWDYSQQEPDVENRPSGGGEEGWGERWDKEGVGLRICFKMSGDV